MTPDIAPARVEEAGLNALQTQRQMFYDGWLLRVSPGVAKRARSVNAHFGSTLPVEVECETLDEVDKALEARADILLLDNMSIEDIREAVSRSKGRAKTEISGGVTLERIRELAATGADYVSVGALTHSAPAVDISFDIEPA